MNAQEKIKGLVQKLNDETISAKEYAEFLSLVNDSENRLLFDQVLDQDIDRFCSNENVKSIGRFTRRRWITRISVAASILLLILAGIFLYIQYGDSQKNHLTYKTSNGETLEVELPDQSIVTLNANSEMTWRSTGNDLRKVILSGEAFFDVRHQNGKPFQVYTQDLIIQVLGTSFNVNNRNGKEEIFLKKGKVKIQNQKYTRDSVLLTPGESAYFNETTPKIIKTTDQKFADQSLWKEGVLKFTDIPVREILGQVEAIYGVNLVLVDKELLLRPMDFALPYSNWEVVSQGLALALGTRLVKHDDYYEFQKKINTTE